MVKMVLGTLRKGHKVMWRGAWGKDPAVEATVEAIEICAINSKNGTEVKSVAWNTVKGYSNRQVVVTLDNGHWAYGYQLDKMPEPQAKDGLFAEMFTDK